MKKLNSFIVFLFLVLWNLYSTAQLSQPHQSQSPPLNPGYPFTRGMFVDCADGIVKEISNGNTNKLQLELNNYIRKNYITYIVLCGLEHNNIFGNPIMESALSSFMSRTRATFPGIQIGISGNDSEPFLSTDPMIASQQFAENCFPMGNINNINNFNEALNDVGLNSINLKKSELCKFFFRAVQFGKNTKSSKFLTNCKTSFDAFYLEYRYWNHTSSLEDMQNEFSNYKTILSLMKILKCNYNCIKNIDAEFLPTERYNSQAWTAIDQITEADPLADRLMIPAFNKNASIIYDQICKILHFLSDRFSKPNSKIFIELNAESSAFHYCNSTSTPQNYLGDYLNGTVNPNGNMYSVEKMFLNKFNDVNYLCTYCSCKPYQDNHYTISNPVGNSLLGVMWTPFSMLKKHSLFRYAKEKEEESQEEEPISIKLTDLNGRIIKSYKTLNESTDFENNSSIANGIYFLTIVYPGGKQEVRKTLINHR